MQLTNKGTPIKEWLLERAHVNGVVRSLALSAGLTTKAIYMYYESDRDIRVVVDGKKAKIYEVKRLDK